MKKDIALRNLRNLCVSNDEAYKIALYSRLTDMGWWSDDNLNDIERERFLYQAFIEYYNIVANGEIKETEVNGKEHENRFRLINLCKLQLDNEISRVNKKMYVREDF